MLRDALFFGRSVRHFTLQWHLTNACAKRCAHCYDRSGRDILRLAEGRKVLRGLFDFCQRHDVHGHVNFSGGDPFLHPDFFELYDTAGGAAFTLGVLGNPVSERQLDALVKRRTPRFYQVSLEGLRAHNDSIRGEGNFDEALGFLELLRARGIKAHVMLTLTGDNLEQVLPLVEVLRGKADRFAFNRVAQVGEGAQLTLPDPHTYERFLREYEALARELPMLGRKEGLLNLLRVEDGLEAAGGCTGVGCGAAFNFVALLPDGELHACRKFPSPIGHVRTHTLEQAWASKEAQRYRRGNSACAGCAVKNQCGGCMAVVHGAGLDPFSDADPHCFAPGTKAFALGPALTDDGAGVRLPVIHGRGR